MSTLTEEQKARIHVNRQKALERRKQIEDEQRSNLQKQQNARNYVGPSPKRANVNKPIQQQSKSLLPNNSAASSSVQPQKYFPIFGKENAQPQQASVSSNSGPSTSKVNQPNVGKERFDPLKGYKPNICVDFELISHTEVQVCTAKY